MSAERVLMVHNAYQLRGGEDSVVDAEIEMLRAKGHEVLLYGRSNEELTTANPVVAAADTLWSARTVREIDRIVDSFRPDIVHAHNTFPLVSPSLYWTASRRRVPMVQTLHNFRLICPQAMLLRDGVVCEDCVGKLPWRAVVHRCYRGSATQSGALVAMIALHRATGSFNRKVSRYIALTEFAKETFVRGGLKPDLIAVKPNFVTDPGPAPAYATRRGFLFVGRLSPEKGVDVLRRAAAATPDLDPIDLVGVGPAEDALRSAPGLRVLGWCAPEAVQQRMHRAAVLVMPSIWYEGFPRTLVEAFASGLPVIASRLGNMAALIRHGETGLLFPPGDADALASTLTWAHEHPDAMRTMSANARAEFEARYTPDRNYAQLVEIYRSCIDPTTRT